MKKGIAEVAIGVPVPEPFHYRIPLRLSKDIKVGHGVWVPFRNRLRVGYVVGLLERSKVARLKYIRRLLDPHPIVGPDIMELTKWMADYYFSSLGEAIEAAIPGPIRRGRPKVKRRRPVMARPTRKTVKPKPISKLDRAIRSIERSLDCKRFEVFLLYNTTAQAKTEVYLQAIAHAISQGRSCIFLVPEIASVPRVAGDLESRFGELVAIFHSRLSPGERFRQWQRIRDGEARIAIGVRSAIFSPVKDLGLIVVDEEHDHAYKQDDAPRYNARDVAIARARQQGACVILGSQTPSLESYYNAKRKIYKLIRAKVPKGSDPFGHSHLPSVRIVDMREEQRQRKGKRIFSRILEGAIRERLAREEMVILFLNRRGFATYINCKNCGFVARCRSCQVSLTYNFHKKSLVCRYCNYHQELPEVCPECGNKHLSYFGLGTQKVESEAARLFPGANISRMDLDTARHKGSYQKILDDLRKGRVNILVGTQMITSGIEVPNLTLVGAISADTTLNLPDFRSSERTFQLLAKVAGIAEGEKKKRDVIIQTYSPNHYSLLATTLHDFDSFYREEVRSRRELGYPPLVHLVNITLRGKREEKVIGTAKDLAKRLKRSKPKAISILGPAPLAIAKLRGRYRWHIIVKGKEVGLINNFLRKILGEFKVPGSIVLTVNVDPVTML